MKDYAKLVILGSSALLVLLAVFLMLYLSYPREDNNAQAQNDKPGEGAKPPAGPGETKPPEEIAGPEDGGGETNGTIEAGEPGKDYTISSPASLRAIVEESYRATNLYDGKVVKIESVDLPKIAARLVQHYRKYHPEYNIDSADTQLPAGTVIRLPNVYIVVSGDNLESIAKRVYNDRKQWQAIQGLNMDVVPDATKMKPGTVLILP